MIAQFGRVRTALCNLRGIDPQIVVLGHAKRLIFGLVRDEALGFCPFTYDPERDHAALHDEAADGMMNYALSAAGYLVNDIERGERDDPHR
jgi:hypothetical protein